VIYWILMFFNNFINDTITFFKEFYFPFLIVFCLLIFVSSLSILKLEINYWYCPEFDCSFQWLHRLPPNLHFTLTFYQIDLPLLNKMCWLGINKKCLKSFISWLTWVLVLLTWSFLCSGKISGLASSWLRYQGFINPPMIRIQLTQNCRIFLMYLKFVQLFFLFMLILILHLITYN
jgi:hypothetical protein